MASGESRRSLTKVLLQTAVALGLLRCSLMNELLHCSCGGAGHMIDLRQLVRSERQSCGALMQCRATVEIALEVVL